ncbi:rod shape-determining protein MreD [Weissella soli]|uniref:rod shape-determining protein MreD n=1 Tax=Weissella soli TaxID=155866 RepID=UPI00359FB5CE
MFFKYLRTWWVHPLLVFVALLLDGSLAFQGAEVLYKMPMAASPYLVILAIIMPLLSGTQDQLSTWNMYGTAFIAGLIYDIYYTGYVGVSMIGFPLMVWLASSIQQYFTTSFLWGLSTWFLTLSAYLIFDYLVFGVINVADMSGENFILFHMFPSLILNIMLYVIFFSLLNWLYNGSRIPDIASYDVASKQLDGRMPLRRRSQR